MRINFAKLGALLALILFWSLAIWVLCVMTGCARHAQIDGTRPLAASLGSAASHASAASTAISSTAAHIDAASAISDRIDAKERIIIQYWDSAK